MVYISQLFFFFMIVSRATYPLFNIISHTREMKRGEG